MEFTIKRDTFQEAVQRTLTIADRKTTNSMFNYILFTAQGGELTLSVTDREIYLVSHHECLVNTPGETALPSRKLYDLIRQSQGEDVHVSVSDTNIAHITCGRATFKIFGVPAENYPRVMLDESQCTFQSLPVGTIKELITGSHYAVSTDEYRKSLQGVFFHSQTTPETGGTYLVMVGTDGNRMAITKIAVSAGDWSFLETGVIIPRRGLMEIKKILDGPEDKLLLGLDKGTVIIKKGSLLLRVSLIAESFPNYRKVIPEKTDATLGFAKHPVLQALRRMGILASEDFSGVVMDLREGLMTLSSANPEIGEAKEEIEVSYNGPEAELNFDVNYLISALDVLEGEDAVFRLNIHGKANVLSAADSDHYLALITQLKTS